MIDASDPAARRRFYLTRALRRRSAGAGSDLEYLMNLPRTALPVDVAKLLQGETWCAVGAIATRAYMPERGTKDIGLGRVDEKQIEEIVSVVREHLHDAESESDIRQYAELGRLERSQAKERDQGCER